MSTPKQIAREAAEKISVALYSAGSPSHIIPISEPIVLAAIRRAVRDTGAVEAMTKERECVAANVLMVELAENKFGAWFAAERNACLEKYDAALAKLKAIAGDE